MLEHRAVGDAERKRERGERGEGGKRVCARMRARCANMQPLYNP
jgi:hypothetical protein